MTTNDSADSHRAVLKKLAWSSVLTLVFLALEITAGIYANSLALIGDGLHNFTDALALLLALSAVALERKPATHAMSYGYQRAGILAAFVNAATLVAFTVYIFFEAWRRMRAPEPVDTFWMMVTAAAALLLNGGVTIWIRRESRSNITVRSAVLHMLGDAFSSAGIIFGSIAIRVTGLSVLDPILSLLIGVLILWSSWGILKETVNLLLEGTPGEIDPRAVSRDLEAIAGVEGVHHLHIWALNPARPALSCHVQLGDVSLKSTADILRSISGMLGSRYGISHTTVQFEHSGCADDDPECLP